MTQHHGRIVKVMGDGVLVEFASAVKGLMASQRPAGAAGGMLHTVHRNIGAGA